MSYKQLSSGFKLFTGKPPTILKPSIKDDSTLKEPVKETAKLPQDDADPLLKTPDKEPSELDKVGSDPALKPPGKEPAKSVQDEPDLLLKAPGKEPSKLDKEEGDRALKIPGEGLEPESGFKPGTSDKSPIKGNPILGFDPLTGKPAVAEADWLTGKKGDRSKQLGLAGGGALGAGTGLGNLGELSVKGGSAAVTVYESGAGAGGLGYGLGAGIGSGSGFGGGSAAGAGHGLGGGGAAGSFGGSGHGLGAGTGF